MKLSKSIIFNGLVALSIGLLSTGCEDVIQVDVIQKSPKIVVDAFVNNQLDTQTIKLTRSIGYFDSSGSEPAITNAQVAIIDQSSALPKLFVFQHNSQGKYQFVPNATSGDTFTVGHDYALLVVVDNDTLVSFSPQPNNHHRFNPLGGCRRQWTANQHNREICRTHGERPQWARRFLLD